MKPGDAINGVTADAGKMRHSHVAATTFINERKARNPFVVGRKTRAHSIQKTLIDLVNDLEMSRQQFAKKINAPFLQRLRQQGVIGVSESRARYIPCFFPAKSMFIHEQTHQLSNGDGGMRVVKLDCPSFVESRGRITKERMNSQHVL